MEKILIVVAAVLLISLVTDLAPRLHLPPPLALVVIGAVIGSLPFVPAFHVDPQWLLVGVLPPLLYSAAIAMPAIDFRRNVATIGIMSFVLVVISALIVGWFFALVIPGINYATGVALGAIVSPTDAVATSIAKRVGVPARVIAVLEGESMLNDASALVLLRAAISATAASISFWGVAVNFVYSLFAAAVVGLVVGMANLWLRSRVRNATAATAISFTVPYLAYVPAEQLHASGLVAAVTAGVVTGVGAVGFLTPAHRMSDMQNWRTVELIAEGGVFLLMGLELYTLIVDVHDDHQGVQTAMWVGVAALAVVVFVRAGCVVPLAWWLDRKRQRGVAVRPMLEDFTASASEDALPRRRGFARWRRRLRRHSRRKDALLAPDLGPFSPDTAARINSRITRLIADIDYYAEAPLGAKESTIIVWAGLRGVVTVAAAQTLPDDTPNRSLVVLTAFVVASASLLLQGGTLAWLVRTLSLPDESDALSAERRALRAELDRTARRVMSESDEIKQVPWLLPRLEQANREAEEDADADAVDGSPDPDSAKIGSGIPYGLGFEERVKIRKVRREIIAAQRQTLVMMRRQGTYSSRVLSRALGQLDAEEISLDAQRGS
ncbi:MAG: sodium:proton antiporter [Gordonia sp. (in: high G+C Gram-positive bacteria)]